MRTTRRQLLALSATAAAALPPGARAEASAAARDLEHYIGFGNKASGGPGDSAAGAWMEEELRRAGYAAERQSFTVPAFDAIRAELVTRGRAAKVIPQAVVTPTPGEGITAPIAHLRAGEADPPGLAGAIALIALPFARWSSLADSPVRELLNRAAAGGARAAILVTTGPSGDALALNADPGTPAASIPVAILAPRDAAGIAEGASATLFVTGAAVRRPAFNVIGRLARGSAKWIVVSTPRSGWFTCAGERGPGIATWLALARWAPAALPHHSLIFLANSGHEYEYLGGEHALAHEAPPPGETRLWLHLGANLAGREWHERGPGQLAPLPSADAQRFLVTSEPLLPAAQAAFAGLVGLERPYPASGGGKGELARILAAGYPAAAGSFGLHRFHHSENDDERCTDASLIEPVIAAHKKFLAEVAGEPS